LLRPDTVIGEDAPVAVRPPGEEVTVYPVIADPPVFVGAEKLTDALPLLAVAAIPVGVPGTVVAGVTGAEPLEELPEPLPFVAVTVKV
jgi:hypothetical protein